MVKRVLVGIFLGLLVFCGFSENAQAANTDLNISVQPVLSISLGEVGLQIQPDDEIHTDTMTVNIVSNNLTGYVASISTNYNSDEEGATSLNHKTDEDATIPTFLEDRASDYSFPSNSWGYKVGADAWTYYKMPAKDDPSQAILSTSSVADSGYKEIVFGVKANNEALSGIYENTILVTVVPNYVPFTISDAYAAAGKKPTAAPDGHYYYSMQDMSPEIIAMTDTEVPAQVFDERDNKLYWITKLADGNIWMTQNLDYDIVEGDNIISNLDGTTGVWNSSSAYPPHATTTGSVPYDNRVYNGTYSYDPGSKYIPNGNQSSTASSMGKDINCTTSSNDGENCHYHVGNYYQFNAAVAGAGSEKPSSQYDDRSEVTSSICPKGWRLPSGVDDTSERYGFAKLASIYAPTLRKNIYKPPLYFVYVSRVKDGDMDRGYRFGNYGYYWTSMGVNYWGTPPVFEVSLYDEAVISGSYGQYGNSVRCVAMSQPSTLSDISTMQQMTPQIVMNTAEGKTKQLRDERDNKLYWVTKLADGNIWMTQNLDFDIAVNNVTPELSDVSETWDANSIYPPTVTGTTLFEAGVSDVPSTYSYNQGSVYLPDGTGEATAINCTASSNDGENCHYHIGNHYQFNAVTAGIGSTINTYKSEVPSSICPKGWRLPVGAGNGKYSFDKLLETYDIADVSENNLDISSPLYLVRGGYVDGAMQYQGEYSFYWASTSDNASSAYKLAHNIYLELRSGTASRTLGFSARCVAR